MAAKKKISKKIRKTSRPKNIWHSVTKLETFLKKAQVQSGVFINALHDLRERLSFEIKIEIVKSLCCSVNGDILHSLWEQKDRIEKGKFGNSIEENSLIIGLYDTLVTILNIHHFRIPGETLTITKDTAKSYTFEEYPESLDNEAISEFTIEILRPGWKVDDKIVIKPIVFELSSKSDLLNSNLVVKQEGVEKANVF